MKSRAQNFLTWLKVTYPDQTVLAVGHEMCIRDRPLAAQGKTDEKTLLDCIDKMIENDQYYQGIKEKELKHLKLSLIHIYCNRCKRFCFVY